MILRSTLLATLIFVLGTSVGAQEEEPPQRIPAAFMSYLGADWLERPGRISEEMPDEMLAAMGLENGDIAVSYTHLTLPTILLV